MGTLVRQATSADAGQWAELLKLTLGDDYPDKQVYDPGWTTSQFSGSSELETWVAEVDGRMYSAVSFLPPLPSNANPVANLGRHLNRPEAFANGAAQALLAKVEEVTQARDQLVVSRVFASDNAMQIAFEKAGFTCVGFQPSKHQLKSRESVLFYYKFSNPQHVKRLPISQYLPLVNELATAVLTNLGISHPSFIHDGVPGYPIQSDLEVKEASREQFEKDRAAAAGSNPPKEISGLFNQGPGFLRTERPTQARGVMGYRGGRCVAGLLCVADDIDRCLRIVDSYSTDDLSTGTLMREALKLAQDHLKVVYTEVDILMTAPQLLKVAEQLGFVPIAYLPAIFSKDGSSADVVKMVKLNAAYSPESVTLTNAAKSIASIVDHNFEDQKMGVAIINLLRGLPFFVGLGDGELRKIARLFTQKLYRPGDIVFARGDSSAEAYVVIRGQVDIVLEEGAAPIANVTTGQIFGELAFLDSTPRSAKAVASQASIVQVISRTAFNELVQREPHLGMVVMRNIAIELTNRLRKTNAAMMRK